MIPKDELQQMYWNEEMTQLEIAEVVGVPYVMISKWMKSYGIESRTSSESHLVNSLKPLKKELEEMYCNKKMSIYEIADVVGVDYSSVSNWMREYMIKSRTISESMLGNAIKLSKEDLEKMYCNKRMPQLEIADIVGVSTQTICNWMNAYNIKSRTRSELKMGENHPNWKGGISFEPYCEKFNNIFKESVRKRDDYMCKLCGCTQNDNGRKLDVHHIHYDKENCYPDVVALCRSCNIKVNSNRDYWESYFEDQLLKRGMFCWSILL
jgi:DNA-binding XRE family transcriptional regulator/transposase-like protein